MIPLLSSSIDPRLYGTISSFLNNLPNDGLPAQWYIPEDSNSPNDYVLAQNAEGIQESHKKQAQQ